MLGLRRFELRFLTCWLAPCCGFRRGHLSSRWFDASGALWSEALPWCWSTARCLAQRWRSSWSVSLRIGPSDSRCLRRSPTQLLWSGAICCSRMSAPCSTGAFRSRGRVRARSLFSARIALLMDWFQGTACLPLATRWRRPPTRRSGHRRWSIALSLALSPRGSACRVRGLSGRYAVRCSVVAALCFVFSLTLLQRPLPESVRRFDRRLRRFSPGVLVLGSGAPCLDSSACPLLVQASCARSHRGVLAFLFGPCDRPGPRVGAPRFGASRGGRVSRSPALERLPLGVG